MQAKDITTEEFLRAAQLCHERNGWAFARGVHEILAETFPELPYKVTLAKLAKLDRQHIIEGCACGCSSPMWIVVGKHEHNGLNRLVDWDDHAAVKAAIRMHVRTVEVEHE